MRKINCISWLMRNFRITFFIIGLLFAFGIYALSVMPKAEFPDYTIRQGVVVAVYPGASTEQVEVQVARPLERYLFTFKEVKRSKTTSRSSNGMCLMMVELEDWVKDKDAVWSKIKHGINAYKASLPGGVLGVVVNDDFGDTSALLIAIDSDQRSYRELHEYANTLSDNLRRVESVSNIRIFGDIPQQISLTIDRNRLSHYGITDKQLMQTLQGQQFITTAGSISSKSQNINIHVAATLNNEQEIADQIIHNDNENHVVRVRDIARITREYDHSDGYIQQDGRSCILLSMEMKDGNNIVHYGEEVAVVIDQYRQTSLPQDVRVTQIANQARVVGDSVESFLRDLIISMIIIIVVMLILFPWRTAVVAAITIPLTTFISIGIMYMVGIPLNTVTLAALVIVLGMVVDNSIVVLDGYLEYRNKGLSRWHASAESARHYFMPMALATLCVSIIFFPFLITMSGQTLDFLSNLPWTIAINLLVSLLLAVAVIPLLEYVMIKKIKPKKAGKRNLTDWVQLIYDRVLEWTFRHPWVTITGAGASIILSVLICMPFIKLRTMPFADREQFAVEIFLPENAGIDETRAITDSICNVLKADHRVKYITSFVGCSSPRFQMSYAPQMGGKNFAQLIVNVSSTADCVDVLDLYAPQYADYYPNAFVKFKQLDYQNQADYEFRFYGEDIDSLHWVSEQLMHYMRLDPEIEWVHSDWEKPQPLAQVTLDPVSSAQLGINNLSATLQTAIATSDLKVGSVWEEAYEVPIIIKNGKKPSFENDALYSHLEDIKLQGAGAYIPLRQVGRVAPEWHESAIIHRNGIRCMCVSALSKRNVLPKDVEKRIEHWMADSLQIPSGIRVEMGGIVEFDGEENPKIAAGFSLALLIIFFFILFNFKKYRLSIVCIAAITLLIPGAIIGLALMNRMLGLTAIFGVITLMGMIMRNEILIFEHAEALVRKGWKVKDAAMDAGRRRMIPIFLTTATTAVGVVPMIIAGTSFWMPVGVTILMGGIGSLILVVTVLPVVYWKINKETQK